MRITTLSTMNRTYNSVIWCDPMVRILFGSKMKLAKKKIEFRKSKMRATLFTTQNKNRVLCIIVLRNKVEF